MSREENNCKQQLQHQQQQQQQQQKVDQKRKKVPLSFSYWWSPSFTCKIDPGTNLLMAVFSLETHNPPSKSHLENRQSCRENRWIKSC